MTASSASRGSRPTRSVGWAEWLTVTSSSRRRALALVAGICAALALPPLHAVPLLLPAFMLFGLLLHGASGHGAAFSTGWFFGTGFFLVGLYWLGLPMVVDVENDGAKDLILGAGLGGTAMLAVLFGILGTRFLAPGVRGWRKFALVAGAWIAAGLVWIVVSALFVPAEFGWMIPFAVFGMAAGLAIFPGLAAAGASMMRLRGVALLIGLAVMWTVTEWLRGHVLTGFPWNLIATVWLPYDTVSQNVSWAGAYGLGFLTVLVATLPAALFMPVRPLARIGAVSLAVVFLGGLWAVGQARLPVAPVGMVDNVRLRLVQPSIPQRLKWSSRAAADNLAQHMELSRDAASKGVTHLVWPETATGYFLTTDSDDPAVRQRIAEFRRHIATIVPPGGALVTGAVRHSTLEGAFYNSVQVLRADGEVSATYDKHHLVPFGEYVPARGVLAAIGVERLAHSRQDFTSGPGPRTLETEGLPPMSPLVCYEAIFPGGVALDGQRPQWLLNVTNDAWFGTSAGPYQHFAAARMRAIEEGLPLVRVANSGISAVVDPYGRVLKWLPLNRSGVIDSGLPVALPPTPYARWGDWTVLLLLLLGLGAIGIVSWKERK